MAYSTVDTVGGSDTAVETIVPTMGDAQTGDDVFVHLMWSDPTITLGDVGDWTLVAGTNVTGPQYMSALYHLTLAGADDVTIDWTGACDVAWQVIASGGLDTDPVELADTRQSTSAAILPRLIGLAATDHVICFAGAVNVLSKDNVVARPDVGFITAEATEANSGIPTLWVGQFAGTIGDLDTTFPAAVYFDPPPTHSVGHTVAVAVA
jgi:hypothetical protein